jgi:hypothetical protein
MEGSLVAYKVFTNGSVLQASEINDNLMRQSVMVFSNAAARTAAITSPLEGMLTWLEDLNIYQYYNGSAWVTASVGMGSALTHIQTSTFSAVSSVILDNVFNSSFTNYRMNVNITAIASGDADLRLVFRSGGTDVTTALGRERLIQTGTSVSGTSGANNTFGSVGITYPSMSSYTVDIFNPNLARYTSYVSNGGHIIGGTVYQDRILGIHALETVIQGIKIFPSGSTISGTVSIYGYSKG